MSDARREAQALRAGRRMIARGERPLYRVRTAQDGSWAVDAAPWLDIAATGRSDALAAARAALAAWLEVDPRALDMEAS